LHIEISNLRAIYENTASIFEISRPSLLRLSPLKKNILVLDGIGKMECFAEVFKRAVSKALNSTNIVIGTIAHGGDDFMMEVRSSEDVEMHEVTQNNESCYRTSF
jgi:nucleoside-triphosphatase THEP1